jgi:acyl-coenzyme A thioesterase PaaI-like protein
VTALDEVVEPAGLRLLRERFADGPPVGVADMLDMRPAELGVGRVAFVCEAQASFANPMGTVHGGIVATLLDSALGCAVQTTLDAGELRAEATVVHAGRRQATAEARLTDRAGRVLATATTTCLVLSG